MKVGRYKILFIYQICLIFVLFSGCQMKKQIDVGSEFSDSSEDITYELAKVDNSKGDIEKIVEKFAGMTVDNAIKKGAEYNENEGKINNDEIKDAIRLTGLEPDDKKHVGKYSLGMKQRLGLAQALMENLDILILDEPMNGLDNEGVKEIRQLLLKRKEMGNLVLIASHNEEDIRVLCDEIFYFDNGKIIDSSVL